MLMRHHISLLEQYVDALAPVAILFFTHVLVSSGIIVAVLDFTLAAQGWAMAATKRTVPPEDRDYVQFFADLGIPDLQKRVFLAGLLRTFRDAAMKLDKNL